MMKVLHTGVEIDGYDVCEIELAAFSEAECAKHLFKEDQVEHSSRRHAEGNYMMIVILVDEDVHTFTVHSSELGEPQ